MESIERIPAAVVRTAVRIDGTLLKSNDTYRYQVLYVLVQTAAAVCGYCIYIQQLLPSFPLHVLLHSLFGCCLSNE